MKALPLFRVSYVNSDDIIEKNHEFVKALKSGKHYILFFSVHPQVLAASSAPQLGGQFRISNQSRMKKEVYRENL